MIYEDSPRTKPKWSESLARKWSNIRRKAHLFQDKDDSIRRAEDGEWRSSGLSEREKKIKIGGSPRRDPSQNPGHRSDLDPAQDSGISNYRIFVSTWNVGGRSPPSSLNLDDWLLSSSNVDIYVLGFQEIVPLNASNVLIKENKSPAKKWVSLIRNTLNSSDEDRSHRSISSGGREKDLFTFSGDNSLGSLSSGFSEGKEMEEVDGDWDSNCGWSGSDEEDDDGDSFRDVAYSPSSSPLERESEGMLNGRSRYSLVARKQMVGIFLTVWARTEIKDEVKDLRVSSVGRGLIGYFGNKGSISISMSLQKTSFCFVCCHLTSGQREGDELRRNSDVMEILRRTRFSPLHFPEERRLPETILSHSRVIWLGDLNYRLALCHQAAWSLALAGNWSSLLENDQLHKEQRSGRVFEGWKEREISFPPTYKYLENSDRFAGEVENAKEKRRTPAWCDRILWYGKGLTQLSYLRGDSKLSDHRPVYGVFSAEID